MTDGCGPPARVAVVTAGIGDDLAVLPALVGAGYGMLGTPLPVVDWTMCGGLAAVVAVVALVTTVPITLRRRAVS